MKNSMVSPYYGDQSKLTPRAQSHALSYGGSSKRAVTKTRLYTASQAEAVKARANAPRIGQFTGK